MSVLPVLVALTGVARPLAGPIVATLVVPLIQATLRTRALVATGVMELLAVVVVPSSPYVLAPQHSTVPPESTAQLVPLSAVMAVVPLSPLTATGVLEGV